jgi:hypothetical protein
MDLSIHKRPNPCDNLIIVDNKSDIDFREEVFKIAEYFKRELNYDKVPYSSFGIKGVEHKALLFTVDADDQYKAGLMPYRIFGSCCFTKINFPEDKDYWVLEWIWLHPFFRNRGNLKKYWVYLEKNFDDFLVREPVSNDMKKFLEHAESEYKHRVIPI